MVATKFRKNKLSSEQSPYLQQHATNPVQWYPWGEEAFTIAKQQNKPIFLSIGYATCHWCHVMAHESFEDEEVANVLNDSFVCIKVDREERPDLDNIYMKICQLLTGSGGWPLTIIMTPDKKPFFAATYLPKHTRFTLIGIIELTMQIQHLWRTQQKKLEVSAEQITRQLSSLSPSTNQVPRLDSTILDRAYETLLASFDEHYGGFSSTPKFPIPSTIFFLLRYWKRTKNPYALTMVERTLEQMRLSGIFDQIGYGFHRYATDREWNIPHFEKMLYDQALIILAYTETFQVTHNLFYRQVAEEVITYVLRDLTSPEGGFYTAEDADSEDEEGKFYTWTSQELQTFLSSSDFDFFTKLFSITTNQESTNKRSQKRFDQVVLFYKHNFKESAQLLGVSEPELTKKIKDITSTLYDARKKRIPPLKDDKILSDWNGLMIAALAKAGRVFCEKSYVKVAEKAAGFLAQHMIKKNGEILHRYRNSDAAIQGFADDYAFTIWGFIELYQATFASEYLNRALTLNRYFLDYFWDDVSHGFFFSKTIDATLPRIKEWYDGAIPSANSVAAMNLLRLGRLTANASFETMADTLFRSISTEVISDSTRFISLLSAVDFAVGPSQEILIVGVQKSDDQEPLLAEIHTNFLPNTVIILLSPQTVTALSEEIFPFARLYPPIDKKTTVYVCINYKCHKPVTTVHDLKKLLS